MSGLSIYYVILIVVCLAGAAYLYVRHRKAASTSSSASAPAATSVAAKIDAAVVDLKTHVESTVANAAESIKTRVATVGAATVSKITGQPVGIPVAGTANAPAPAPAVQPSAPAPAAPASPSVTSEPPPALVAAPAQPAAGGGGTDGWPQVVEVDGVHLLADAPINPAWKIDPMTKAYDNAHSYGFEPSNGGKCVPPQPLRSPAGYPLFYALGAGNAPVGSASVLYNGNTFPDDAAVAAYIAAVAAARAAGDVAAAAAAAQVFAGPVPLTALTKSDLEFLWWATSNAATPKLHNWQFDVLSGSRVAIQQALASVSGDIAWLRKYDAAGYKGVLRSHYDAAVKA